MWQTQSCLYPPRLSPFAITQNKLQKQNKFELCPASLWTHPFLEWSKYGALSRDSRGGSRRQNGNSGLSWIKKQWAMPNLLLQALKRLLLAFYSLYSALVFNAKDALHTRLNLYVVHPSGIERFSARESWLSQEAYFTKIRNISSSPRATTWSRSALWCTTWYLSCVSFKKTHLAASILKSRPYFLACS